MSAAVDHNPRFLACGVRAFAITCLFLCAGPPITFLLFVMTLAYCAALGGVFSQGAEAAGLFVVVVYVSMIWLVGDLSWQLLAPEAAIAGFVGLIVGIGEVLSWRLNLCTVAALGIAIRTVWAVAADLTSVAHLGTITRFDTERPLILIAIEAAAILSFVISMILCRKIAALVRLRTPAVAGLSPP